MSRDPDQHSTAKFIRGLTIGALIGAVLAGSSIWTRRHAGRRSEPAGPDPVEPAAVGPAAGAEVDAPTRR